MQIEAEATNRKTSGFSEGKILVFWWFAPPLLLVTNNGNQLKNQPWRSIFVLFRNRYRNQTTSDISQAVGGMELSMIVHNRFKDLKLPFKPRKTCMISKKIDFTSI
jgi:hypothetical protein